MGRRFQDITGHRFGLLTVIEKVGLVGNNGYWRCVCDCGAVREVRASSLFSHKARSCGSSKHRRGTLGPTQLRVRLWYAKAEARKRGLEWSLSDEQFVQLSCCPCSYCGRGGCNATSLRDIVEAGGIDRFDNSLGYTPENSVPCCTACNQAKNDMTAEQFIAHCAAVAYRYFKHVN